MKAVRIDFVQPVSTLKRILRIALLSLGIVLATYSFIQQRQIGAEKKALQWQINDITKSGIIQTELSREPNALNNENEAIKRMSEVVQQLNTPWDQLFTTLEQATNKDIFVISVIPSLQQRSLSLQAAATDIKTAIDFTQRLSKSGALTKIHLTQEEPDEDNADFPLNFLVTATWNISP